ncbi:MAG TPA: diacylglycerol kinase family protein [Actinomycetota bacterium]|nr:diacylglycerol kinase family protein [Actinomycetota bacterium]
MTQVMLVVNPRAGSVSPRARDVIARALSADFKVEVAETTARAHATELSRDAVDRGFDAVIAMGGDGTINEVMQSMVGTDIALGILPGGSTNVAARSLGIPRDIIDATAYLAERIRSGRRRRVNTARFEDRYFLFSAGLGLDGEVVKRVEQHGKGKHFEWAFVRNAVAAAAGPYRKMTPAVTMSVDGGEPIKVLLAVTCNGRPFTYLKRIPVEVCPEAHLDGALDVFALRDVSLVTIPRIAWSVLVSRSHTRWKASSYHHDVSSISLTCEAALPAQVDGDYIGEFTSAHISLVPDSLDLIV